MISFLCVATFHHSKCIHKCNSFAWHSSYGQIRRTQWYCKNVVLNCMFSFILAINITNDTFLCKLFKYFQICNLVNNKITQLFYTQTHVVTAPSAQYDVIEPMPVSIEEYRNEALFWSLRILSFLKQILR